jgi:hypothetical protein
MKILSYPRNRKAGRSPISVVHDYKNVTLQSPNIKVEDIPLSSTTLYTWKCSDHIEEHIWEATIKTVRRKGCPFAGCAKSRPHWRRCGNEKCEPCTDSSIMSATFVNNHRTIQYKGNDNPFLVGVGSYKRLEWECQICFHVWQTTPSSLGCCPFPYCTKRPLRICDRSECSRCFSFSLAGLLPKLEKRRIYFIAGNSLNPREIMINSDKLITLECHNHTKIHEFEQRINNLNQGCPFAGCRKIPIKLCGDFECSTCAKHSVADLKLIQNNSIVFSSKNNVSMYHVTKRSHKDMIWQCPNHELMHQWSRPPDNVHSLEAGCPFPPCAKIITQLCDHDNCVECTQASLQNWLVKQTTVSWSSENIIDPRQISIGSGQKAIFTCNQHALVHTWTSPVNDITTREHGCPYPGKYIMYMINPKF